MDLSLEGATELNNLLNLLPIELRDKSLKFALKKGAEVVQEQTKFLVPVDKGQLKRHLAVRAMKPRKGRVGFRVTIRNTEKFVTVTKKGKRHFYPAVIEYGSSRHQPLAPMRMGFERSKDAAVLVVRKMLERDVISVAKGLGLAPRRRSRKK